MRGLGERLGEDLSNASSSSMLEMANSWVVTISFGSSGFAIIPPTYKKSFYFLFFGGTKSTKILSIRTFLFGSHSKSLLKFSSLSFVHFL